MSVLHLNVLPAPVYPETHKATAVVSRTSVRSGSGWRVTACDADGCPVVSVWDASPTTAWTEVDKDVATLARIATKHPDGVPMVRRRAS
ncbi:hypothetical protein [Myxococcus virescens]|uniref:Uncharacterized protein n=1 Tax=Myxococcus virescens TaxID=83456 RepID=A0A511HNK7_9BACT|nr:hypothetical protein [Myxococcus virescens]GEL75172.1 hypothetical protein MVI01_69560 [Myxococcus virescens]SDD64451.1 hypothetical protein SAMN04488504_10297 [Myxococcus virescens]